MRPCCPSAKWQRWEGLGQRPCASVLQPEQTKSCRHDLDLEACMQTCSPEVWGNTFKEKGHRKEIKSDTVREGIINEEAPTGPSFFFFFPSTSKR